jgi:PPM family protein phosphatase
VVIVDVVDAEEGEEEKEPTGTTVLPVTPAPEAAGPPAHRKSRSRRLFRRKDKKRDDTRPVVRLVTVRVVGFFALLILIIGAAAAAIGWYARAGYFVGLAGGRIIIYQGRPGGVLWFHPTIADDPGITTAQVESRHLAELAAGQEESSLSAARAYVTRLVAEQQAAVAAGQPLTAPDPGSVTTTVPVTT